MPEVGSKGEWAVGLAMLVQLSLNGLALGLLYALPAFGIALIYNATGLFNYSQGDLLTLGGYLMLTVFGVWHLPYPIAVLVVLGATLALGYAMGSIYFFPMLIQKFGPSVILIGTVALSVAIVNAVLLLWGPMAKSYENVFGNKAFQFGDMYIMPHVFWIFGIVAVLVILLQYLFTKTITGLAMRAVAQNYVAAQLMGIKVNQIIPLTIALSTVLAAISGILITPIQPLTPQLGGLLATKAFASVLIGGMGSMSGALVGGAIVGISETLIATLVTPTYKDVFTFLVVVSFLLFRPGGIFRRIEVEKV